MANVVSAIARFSIANDDWLNLSKNCFMDQVIVKILGSTYLLFAELPIVVYFFKLFRVLTAHYSFFLQQKMGNKFNAILKKNDHMLFCMVLFINRNRSHLEKR